MIKGIYGIIGMIIIWVCLNTSNIASNSRDIKSNDKELEVIVKRLKTKVKKKTYNSVTFQKKYFKQVFFQQRSIHGAGYTFTWNGKKYTTDYKEEK